MQTEAGNTSEAPLREIARDASPPAGRPSSEAIPYVVQQGDTLWLISAPVYATGSRWQQIYDANRDILDDPDRIQPGQVLLIPSEP